METLIDCLLFIGTKNNNNDDINNGFRANSATVEMIVATLQKLSLK